MLHRQVLAFLGKSEDLVTPIHHLHKALTVRVRGQLSLLEGACTLQVATVPPTPAVPRHASLRKAARLAAVGIRVCSLWFILMLSIEALDVWDTDWLQSKLGYETKGD